MSELERLIQLLARLPGLGPRSARRAALHLLRKREALMLPLIEAMSVAVHNVNTCAVCGNLGGSDPCAICRDPRRDRVHGRIWRVGYKGGKDVKKVELVKTGSGVDLVRYKPCALA